MEHPERQVLAGLLEPEQVQGDALGLAPGAPIEPDEVGVRVKCLEGEDNVGRDEGASVLPQKGPGVAIQ